MRTKVHCEFNFHESIQATDCQTPGPQLKLGATDVSALRAEGGERFGAVAEPT